eukprot:TRINITY_DN2530_c0_g1_i3.p1 TRINITY_DN2530_c0_g1~~TRINITY_DN2530_c0_g1_i3.p1  ORF type:complete len:670 (-),score=281.21 TRINITY_DN2530_c0_g1_i3:392-2401(-)
MALGDEVAAAVLQRYSQLPKTGKPQGREFTVLAGLVLEQTSSADAPLAVIALATGTKCMGQSKLPPDGSIVHDSHAEVLARRCLVRLLGEHLRAALTHGGGGDDAKNLLESTGVEGRFRLRRGHRLHLYISEPPCGDASIYPRIAEPPPAAVAEAARADTAAAAAAAAAAGAGAAVGATQSPAQPLPMTAAGAAAAAAAAPTAGAAPVGTAQPAAAAMPVASATTVAIPAAALHSDNSPTCPLKRANNSSAGDAPHAKKPKLNGGNTEGAGLPSDSTTTAVTAENGDVVAGGQGGSGAHAAGAVAMAYTGAKALTLEREVQQAVGQLRLKSGRSDLRPEDRTESMSCSDKLARWAVLGLQGRLLRRWLEPVLLSSVTVSADARATPGAQRAAMRRAVCDRAAAAAAATAASTPALTGSDNAHGTADAAAAGAAGAAAAAQALELYIIEAQYDRGKLLAQQQQAAALASGADAAAARPIPCGFCLNWWLPFGAAAAAPLPQRSTGAPGEAEVTLGALGRRQGRRINAASRSRLCKACIFEGLRSSSGGGKAVGKPGSSGGGGSSGSRSNGGAHANGGGGSEGTAAPDVIAAALAGLTYAAAKATACERANTQRQALLETAPFRGWLVADPVQEAFGIEAAATPSVPAGAAAPESAQSDSGTVVLPTSSVH